MVDRHCKNVIPDLIRMEQRHSGLDPESPN